MTESVSIQAQVGSAEADPYVIDGMLAARCFIVGMKTAEKHVEWTKRMDAFVGVVTESYPTVDKHAEVQKLRDAYVKAAKEAKKDGRI
jgi:hypothetical protein